MEKFIPEILRGNLSPVYCPVCRGSLDYSNTSSIYCLNGHSYGITPSGHINMIAGPGAGHHQASIGIDYPLKLEREILRILYAEYDVNDTLLLLDAGTGGQELFSNIQLCMRWDRYRHQAIGLVTDGNILPVRNNTVDIVFDTLSGYDLQEVHRILKPGGLLLKTIRINEAHHLWERVSGTGPFHFEAASVSAGAYAIRCYRKDW